MDNQNAIVLMKNLEFRKRTKQFDDLYHFIRENQVESYCKLKCTPRDEYLAGLSNIAKNDLDRKQALGKHESKIISQ